MSQNEEEHLVLSHQPQKIDSESEESGVLGSVVDTVTHLVTGTTIPAPIRRNALKAFGRLCTAAIEIPAAYLEGKAEEKRAETQARVKLISTTANQIAENIKVDPEYARVAVRKFGERVVREQINLDQVVQVAAEEIRQKAIPSAEHNTTTDGEEINDDWLNLFEKEASQKSTEEMQSLFGRILAGEIQQPSSFSIKTVKLVGELDARVAGLFRTMCSLSISLILGDQIIDARVPSLGSHAAMNALQKYGLSFEHLNVLQEFGLIISDYNSHMNYAASIVHQEIKIVPLPFLYQNHSWGLVPSAEVTEVPKELRVHGVALSRSGKELMKIVDTQPHEEYTSALKEYFKGLNYSMIPIRVKTD